MKRQAERKARRLAAALSIPLVFAAGGAGAAEWTVDWTVGEDTALTEDRTVDELTVEAGVTLELAGHRLTCRSLAGAGTISESSVADLTSPDPDGERVTWSTVGGTQTAASGSGKNLFNDLAITSKNQLNDANYRILVAKANLPLSVTYDFGGETPKAVNAYKIHFGRTAINDTQSYNGRGPKDWTFEGSNDGETWTGLDAQRGVVWSPGESPKSFRFANETAYRYYRITVTASSASDYLEFNQLEYMQLAGELRMNVPLGSTVAPEVTFAGGVKVVKEGPGTLNAPANMVSDGADSMVELVVNAGRVVSSSTESHVGNYGFGTLTINGGEMEVNNEYDMILANAGGSSGTINLNGGTLIARRVRRGSGAWAVLNFNGGTIRSNRAITQNGLIASTVTVRVNAGGGTIDSGNLSDATSSARVFVTAALGQSGDTGAMRFKGGRTINIEGALNYTGGTTVNIGTRVYTSNATAKDCILGGLVLDGSDQAESGAGIAAFQYSSALADPADLANVTLKNCGTGSAAGIDGGSIKVDFVSAAWELTADATWSGLVATYGAPDADAVVRIVSSGSHTLTIDQDVAVRQIVFSGTNPNVVVNSGATVATDTITFGGGGANYLKNDGVVVLNGAGERSYPFHNDSRGVCYVNTGRLNVSRVTQGTLAPGFLPEGTNQFVCVAPNAIYDVRGVGSNTTSVRLGAGATICNGTTSSITTGSKQTLQMILDGDATARIYRSFGLVGPGNTATRLDLGDSTLTVAGGGGSYSFFLDNTTVSGTGNVFVRDGALAAYRNSHGDDWSVQIGASGRLLIGNQPADNTLTVCDFVNNGTDASTGGPLIVKGTLTPGNALKKLTLADGSTVKASATTEQTVSDAFSASGTVTIDAADVTAAAVREAPDSRLAVLTVPSVPSGVSWNAINIPARWINARWYDNDDGTSSFCLFKARGIAVVIR